MNQELLAGKQLARTILDRKKLIISCKPEQAKAVMNSLEIFVAKPETTIDVAAYLGGRTVKIKTAVILDLIKKEFEANSVGGGKACEKAPAEGNISSIIPLFSSDGKTLNPEGGGLQELAKGKLFCSAIAAVSKNNPDFAVNPATGNAVWTPSPDDLVKLNKIIKTSNKGRNIKFAKWCAVYGFSCMESVSLVLGLLAGEPAGCLVTKRFSIDFPELLGKAGEHAKESPTETSGKPSAGKNQELYLVRSGNITHFKLTGPGFAELSNGKSYVEMFKKIQTENPDFANLGEISKESKSIEPITKIMHAGDAGKDFYFSPWCGSYAILGKAYAASEILEHLSGGKKTPVSIRFCTDFPWAEEFVSKNSAVPAVPPEAETKGKSSRVPNITYDRITGKFTNLEESGCLKLWIAAYPQIDVEQEITRAGVYMRANSARVSNCKKIINNWLQKVQLELSRPKTLSDIDDPAYTHGPVIHKEIVVVGNPCETAGDVKKIIWDEKQASDPHSLDLKDVLGLVFDKYKPAEMALGGQDFLAFEPSAYTNLTKAIAFQANTALQSALSLAQKSSSENVAQEWKEKYAALEKQCEDLKKELEEKDAEMKELSGDVHICRSVDVRLMEQGRRLYEVLLADKAGNTIDYFARFPGNRIAIRVLDGE